MDTSGFYRIENGEIVTTPNGVDGPGFSLVRDNHTEYTYPQGGWYWFDSYSQALAALVSHDPRHITKLAFLTRFTDNEAIAIDLASIGATAEAAALRRYTNKINVAEYIDLDDPATRGGVQALESVGMISPGRAAEILDTPTTSSEWY